VLDYMRAQPGQRDLPLVLAGFSFGTFVLSHVAARLREEGSAIERMVFVGTAASNWEVAPVPENTLVISWRNRRNGADCVGLRLGATAGIAGCRDSRRRTFPASQAAYPQAHRQRRLALNRPHARFRGTGTHEMQIYRRGCRRIVGLRRV
jgi:thioesterase domain-containing protein